MSKPFERLRKPTTLRDLREIQTELAHLGLLAMWDNRPRSRSSLDLRIYQALISVLDGKRLLLAHLRAIEEVRENRVRPIPERARLLQSKEEEKDWNDAIAQKARSLQQLLGRIDDDRGYFELIEAYRNVGRVLRRNRELSTGGLTDRSWPVVYALYRSKNAASSSVR